jgi:hypothetical protein
MWGTGAAICGLALQSAVDVVVVKLLVKLYLAEKVVMVRHSPLGTRRMASPAAAPLLMYKPRKSCELPMLTWSKSPPWYCSQLNTLL